MPYCRVCPTARAETKRQRPRRLRNSQGRPSLREGRQATRAHQGRPQTGGCPRAAARPAHQEGDARCLRSPWREASRRRDRRRREGHANRNRRGRGRHRPARAGKEPGRRRAGAEGWRRACRQGTTCASARPEADCSPRRRPGRSDDTIAAGESARWTNITVLLSSFDIDEMRLILIGAPIATHRRIIILENIFDAPNKRGAFAVFDDAAP
jgi:hypothetical protein